MTINIYLGSLFLSFAVAYGLGFIFGWLLSSGEKTIF